MCTVFERLVEAENQPERSNRCSFKMPVMRLLFGVLLRCRRTLWRGWHKDSLPSQMSIFCTSALQSMRCTSLSAANAAARTDLDTAFMLVHCQRSKCFNDAEWLVCPSGSFLQLLCMIMRTPSSPSLCVHKHASPRFRPATGCRGAGRILLERMRVDFTVLERKGGRWSHRCMACLMSKGS